MKNKKAILLVSTGTAYKDAISNTIMKIKKKYKIYFPDKSIRIAFTSNHLRKLLLKRENIKIDSVEGAFDKLATEGYKEIVVQSLHILPGSGFHTLVSNSLEFISKKTFDKVTFGRPLLCYMGNENKYPNDYKRLVDALKEGLPIDKNVVFVGHGTHHPSNAAYACLQSIFHSLGLKNILLGTLESYPCKETVLKELRKKSSKEILLIPFLLVAGTHAYRDIASDNKDSWRSILEKEGFSVKVHMNPLGDREEVLTLFKEHTISAKEFEISFDY